jgi:hypothetical protein
LRNNYIKNILSDYSQSLSAEGIAMSGKIYTLLHSRMNPVEIIKSETMIRLNTLKCKRNTSICLIGIVKYLSASLINERKPGYKSHKESCLLSRVRSTVSI